MSMMEEVLQLGGIAMNVYWSNCVSVVLCWRMCDKEKIIDFFAS